MKIYAVSCPEAVETGCAALEFVCHFVGTTFLFFNNLARELPGYVCHLIGSSEADESEKVSHFILAICGLGFPVAQAVLQA
jgi:hypothetical protein